MNTNPPNDRMREMINGYFLAQAVFIFARLGLADLLSAGPRTSTDLAATTKVDPQSLYRVLRALASEGVVEERPNEIFALTSLGETLRSEIPGSMRPAALIAGDAQYKVWAIFRDVIKNGHPGFDRIFRKPLFDFLQDHEDLRTLFQEAMSRNIERLLEAAGRHLKAAGRQIVDVGGGEGALLCAVLEKNATLKGTLFERPEVIAAARQALQNSPLANRISLVEGDFQQSVPQGDTILLSSILHMFADAEAVQVLKNCRASLPAHGQVFIIEQVLRAPNEPDPGKWTDLNMMVMTGGRERTFEQYAQLLTKADFARAELIETGDVYRVVIGHVSAG